MFRARLAPFTLVLAAMSAGCAPSGKPPEELAVEATIPVAGAVAKLIPEPIRLEPEKPEATLPPPVDHVLKSGVLIVISKSSQQMHVFKDGALWDTSPVSTGKRGKETPAGVFPILQKKKFHRSNLYSNAPMPHMQRLTWDGIALHAGYVPGYPASHGCIRLPREFARSLYGLTSYGSTTVVVTDQAPASAGQAKELALNMLLPAVGEYGQLVQLPEPELAELTPAPVQSDADLPVQAQISDDGPTIQLAAAGSAAEAEAYWAKVVARHPDLGKHQKAIIPAKVGSQTFYRLRVSGPDVKSSCTALQEAGTECFNVG